MTTEQRIAYRERKRVERRIKAHRWQRNRPGEAERLERVARRVARERADGDEAEAVQP